MIKILKGPEKSSYSWQQLSPQHLNPLGQVGKEPHLAAVCGRTEAEVRGGHKLGDGVSTQMLPRYLGRSPVDQPLPPKPTLHLTPPCSPGQ